MRRFFAMAIAVVLAIAALCVLAGLWPRQPAYHGRALSAWLPALQHPSPLVRHGAQEAVRKMGTNTVPYLRQFLHAQDSFLKTNLVALLRRQSLVKVEMVMARERRVQAALACVELGPDARPVIADLLEFSKADTFCGNLAEAALAGTGTVAVPPLCAALTNADYKIRKAAIGALANIRPQADSALPALTKCLKDKDAVIRATAAQALGRAGVPSTEVVRALMQALGDPDFNVRQRAFVALAGFGDQISPMLQDFIREVGLEHETDAGNALNELQRIKQRLQPQVPGERD